MIAIDGHSMEPLLASGDRILIEPARFGAVENLIPSPRE
jgi:signal peptidase I